MSHPVAIVTGAASGIGLAVTKHLLSKNYKVVLADIAPSDNTGTPLAQSLSTTKDQALYIQTDVSDYKAQARLFKQAFEWGGRRLDFFAANAGIDDRQSLYGAEGEEEVDEEGLVREFNVKTLKVDLEAVVQGIWLFKYYVRRSEGEGGKKMGKVVITSSAAGLYPMDTNPIYSTAKHGLLGLTRSVGPVFLKENITVNCICPAFVPTNLCPPHVLHLFPKEHITPMSTVLKAFDTFLGDDQMTGQTVELSLDSLYFREVVDYPNESQRWIGTESKAFWEEAYKGLTEGGGVQK